MGTILPLETRLADTYRVVRLIRAGGMGEVYEATHDRLAGRYAIKVLKADLRDHSGILQRFRREAAVTSGLRHPNIVQVLDFNVTPEGYPYLVMEYLDGIELAQEMRRVGAMPVARALDIVGQIASALTAAHARKVIHRDLKPNNLFLITLPGEDREVVKVVDFGISKVREVTTELTREATVMGTPRYMAPEQARGEVDLINERTDEFALGTIAYELLTGRQCFRGSDIPAILYQVVHQQPVPMRQIAPMVGPAVEAVVQKAMSKAQDERYPTVIEFHRDLVRAAAEDHGIHTPALPLPSPVTPQREVITPQPELLIPQPELLTVQPESAIAGPDSLTSAPTFAPPAKVEQRRQVLRSGMWWVGAAIAGVVAAAGAVAIGTREPVPPKALPSKSSEEPAKKPTVAKVATIGVTDAPPGLQVTVDGVAGHLPITLPAGPETHTLLFAAPGYKPHEVRVDGVREHQSLVLNMELAATPLPQPFVTANSPAKSARRAASHKSHKAHGPAPEPDASPTSKSSPVPGRPQNKKANLITDF